ncbi:MAG: hypothetical protein JWP26_900 [Devosia sp.]|nr:hypothetical protein [Devosia sp.]MDB5585930.1 hypothetical protein [Devosia sp.]
MRGGVLIIAKRTKTPEPVSPAMPARERRPDLLDRLQLATQTLHSAELQVAQAILGDPEWVSRSSIKVLAEKAGVSEPTVIRLARKLGCSGYSEFKLQLAEDLIVTRMFLSPEAVVQNSQPSSIAEHMFEAATRTMSEAMAMLDGNALERAARAVAKARRVLCYGVGGASAILAQEAENRLFRLGLAAQASADYYKQRMAVSIMQADDVLLCFSATGKPEALIESAQIAKGRGATVIAVTPSGSGLSNVADITLAVNIFNDEMYFNLPSPTRYAQLYLLDCMAAAVAVELGPQSFQNLKSIRQTLSSMHGTMKYQPIGD